MDILEAKLAVIEAGKQLVKCGLIARTWGNVSCRISDTHFVITPSGREYNALTPDEIVLVSIADCTYEGDIKPSSEKGVHASCYRLRPECNFVIHTHQLYASMAGLAGLDIQVKDEKSAAILGTSIPAAAYGLPGTGKLKKGVSDAIERSDANAALMLHHGAVCLGTDMENAFCVAQELENVCKQTLLDRYEAITGNTAESFTSLSNYIAETMKKGDIKVADIPAFISEREGDTMLMTPRDGGDSVRIRLCDGTPLDTGAKYPSSAELHLAVYNKRDDVNCIIHNKQDDVVAVSSIGKTVKPFLDDFAQIVGVTARCATFDPNNTQKTAKKVVKKLKGRNAVLIKDNGAICAGSGLSDAQAIEMVAEKGCQSFVAASILDMGKSAIKGYECALMRLVYKMKYSKQADK